jgi:hypothetical protein
MRRLQGVGKRFLGERVATPNRQQLDIELFELGIVGHPGLQVRGSSGVEFEGIKLQQDMFFTLELTQANRLASGAGQFEVRGFIPHFECHGEACAQKQTEADHTD